MVVTRTRGAENGELVVGVEFQFGNKSSRNRGWHLHSSVGVCKATGIVT